MLTYQSNIAYTSNNNLTVSPNSIVIDSPNKRGCCQTKRRNYNLVTSSNGISNTTKNSCCSNNKQEGKSCSKKSCTSKKSKYKPNQINNSLQKTKYTETEINSFKNEFDNLVSNGTIRLNEYLEIFEEGSKNTYQNYNDNEVKAKLLNPNLKLDVVSRIDEKANSININIIDVDKNRKYLDQTLNFKRTETNLKKYEESVSIIILARWLAIQNLYYKSDKKRNKTQEDEETPKPLPLEPEVSDCKEKYGIEGDCMCINQDMKCSVPFIRETGKISLLTPCVGHFEPDLSECCFNHDIGLWCTSGVVEGAHLGNDLINCFEEKIISAYTYKAPFLCEFFELPVLWLVLIGLPTSLSGLMGALMGLKGEYRNKDGKNSNSCLCGGDIPTFCCGGFDGVCKDECCNKVELCSTKFNSERGIGCRKKPKCDKKCAYFVYLNSYNPNVERLTSYKLWPGDVEYYTEGDTTKTINKSDCCTVNLPEKCTEKCFNCYYACKLNPNGKGMSWNNGRVLIDSTYLGTGMKGVPCCEGTPNPDLNSKYNYCPENYGKGSGGLPPCGTILAAKLGGPCAEIDKKKDLPVMILTNKV